MLKMSRVLGRLQEISSVKAGWLGGRLRYQRYRGPLEAERLPFPCDYVRFDTCEEFLTVVVQRLPPH